MSFMSFAFYVFLALAVVCCYLLHGKAQNAALLIFSYIFYMWSAPQLGIILAISTLVSYLVALGIQSEWLDWRKLWLVLGCLFQFGMLFFFKYTAFLVAQLTRFFPQLGSFSMPDIIQPLGISFFTFSITGYLFDVYRQKIPAEKNLLCYAVFVSFFPALLSGPIGQARQFLPQLKQPPRFHGAFVKHGALRFVFGLLQKMVVADTIAIPINWAYGGNPTSAGMWVVVILLYSLQIYYDFAGYSNMAIGAAQMLGFSLNENFTEPYLSTSVRSFWKKWHISLTSWLREYIYFPLGGSRRGTFRTYFNILVVFAVSGLWHGAGLTYLCWGLLNGLLQIIELIAVKLFHRPAGTAPKRSVFRSAIGGVYTYLAISATWLLFRAPSLTQLRSILGQVAGIFRSGWGQQWLTDMGIGWLQLSVLAVMLTLCIVVDVLQTRTSPLQKLANTTIPYYLIMLILAICVATFGIYGAGFDPQEFIYFKY